MGLFNKKHSVGKTIAMLRKEKGWTQVELAEKLQVSDKAVSKWEKDDAFPSVEFFPALAKLFDVSIDYLMTGKETEPEIITMSKIELCAKNDDVSMLDEIKGYTNITDENGKSLQDYIVQYKSINVYNKICDLLRLPIIEDIKMALLSNNVNRLEKIQMKKYVHIGDGKKLPSHLGSLAIITDEILDIIIDDSKINETTFEYIVSPNKQTNNVWYWVFPWLIDLTYKNNNIVKFDALINATKQNNQYGFEHKANDDNCLRYNTINIGSRYQEKMFGIVIIKKSTFEQALDKSDIETIEILNEINNQSFPLQSGYRYRATADEIRIAKLKLDKSVSENEIKIQSTIHEGVVNIDELLEINDFKLIKNVLNNYPIHIIEYLYSLFTKKEWRQLFEYAVDNNNSSLANEIIKSNEESISKCLSSYWKENINKKHLFYMDNDKKFELFANSYGNSRYKYTTIEDAINKLQLCKQRILDDLSLKIDKDKIVGELTKEYFESELAKGNEDIVIIKLCVRLEAILRCDYQYSGDFSTMLNRYCDEKLHWSEDDGWGYNVNKSDDKTIKLLNNLRIKRNSIVHSEKSNIELSKEDILYCIEYICKLG